TYASIIAIELPFVVDAIISGTDISPGFRQLNVPEFQVAGGRIRRMNDHYYLMGGQKFLGRYNPMGPDHGPGFIQEYTNAIREFDLFDDGITMSITQVELTTDSTNLHRRDYNAEAQIMPDGNEGLTMFSGVFQPTQDLPFLNAVVIDDSGYEVATGFQQYYNHYHCPTLPLYAQQDNAMHTVFFGGIAQYYDSLGVMVQDNNVPFVKTIARVTRDASGTMAEFKLPASMPGYLGAGAELIPIPDLPTYPNGVINLDELTADTTLAGYIFGGINSSASNIFWINDGTQSEASTQCFKVLLVKNSTSSVHSFNDFSRGTLKMTVYPNPNEGNFVVKYFLTQVDQVLLTISDEDGRVIEKLELQNQVVGENYFERKVKGLSKRGAIYVMLETPYEKAVQKVITN
ncbi:MAG: hypothetical protein JNM00_06360, partial [Flavobacteriales bacterium]|nr:hypothetical protein [Flavobacteriales bacterium]